MTTVAIIVAAGEGKRAGGKVPKQWRTISGKLVIDWSIDAFKNHKLIEQFVIKKLPVVQNLIIEEDNFINERGKILHNGVVSINLILNKQFDIIKFQISDKGFPFSYNKEAIQDEINRAYDIAQQGQAAQAIRAGAFGGGREGIAQAELERNRASSIIKNF